jgi:hypothetical protein
MTGAVNKSRREPREAYLNRRLDVPARFRQLAASSEDAFDAAVSALAMNERIDELAALVQTRDSQTLLEGAIWCPRDGKPEDVPRRQDAKPAGHDVPRSSAAV